jgi:predicted DNA-binding antitoxin AbrB/MazE fold protein
MQEFHAIYENGVLRPLSPLGLPEATEVVATVRLPAKNVAQASIDPILGLMSDDADLLDEIVEEAMQSRETQPFRISE